MKEDVGAGFVLITPKTTNQTQAQTEWLTCLDIAKKTICFNPNDWYNTIHGNKFPRINL